jgi:hypothetical protein
MSPGGGGGDGGLAEENGDEPWRRRRLTMPMGKRPFESIVRRLARKLDALTPDQSKRLLEKPTLSSSSPKSF